MPTPMQPRPKDVILCVRHEPGWFARGSSELALMKGEGSGLSLVDQCSHFWPIPNGSWDHPLRDSKLFRMLNDEELSLPDLLCGSLENPVDEHVCKSHLVAFRLCEPREAPRPRTGSQRFGPGRFMSSPRKSRARRCHDHEQVPALLDVREDAIPDLLVRKIMSLWLPEDVHFVESDRYLQIMRIRVEEKGKV